MEERQQKGGVICLQHDIEEAIILTLSTLSSALMAMEMEIELGLWREEEDIVDYNCIS